MIYLPLQFKAIIQIHIISIKDSRSTSQKLNNNNQKYKIRIQANMKIVLCQVIFIFLLISICKTQESQQVVVDDQNSIEPTVVNPIKRNHPSLNAENKNPAIDSNEPLDAVPMAPQIKTQDQKLKQQVVIQSKSNVNNLQGQKIPANNPQTNQPENQIKKQNIEQALIKAKQQAQKVKQTTQDARRQIENDKKTRDEQEEEQLRNIQFDQTLSKTQRKKQEQKLMFRKNSRKVDQGTTFTQYLFEQGISASQFLVKIPASQQVAINFYTYVSQDNTYVRTKNIEEEQPVKIYIYQNNQKIVFEGEFYYQSYIVFQGEAGAMYLIRVVNNGRTKLISMNLKKLVEDTHLSEKLQTNNSQHIERTQNLAIDIHRWHQEFRKIRMLDFQDLKAIEGYIEKYYSWELIESLVAIILCVFQVKTIQKMLKGGSIV